MRVRESQHATTTEASFSRGTSALQRYLSEIEKIPVLNPREERELAIRARSGDSGAQKELVRRNLRFVVSVARQYARHGVPLEDLINEGNIGLMRAAARFDPARGFRLISYGVWWIRQSIMSYLTDHSRIVRLPAGKVHGLARLVRESERLMQECSVTPSTDALAARLQLTRTQVEILQELPTVPFSLDAPVAGEESTFAADSIEDKSSTEDWLIDSLRREDIRSAMDVLDPREADILRRYYGLASNPPESLQSIGIVHGVTRERVRQLRDRALWKLRHSVHADLLEEYAQ